MRIFLFCFLFELFKVYIFLISFVTHRIVNAKLIYYIILLSGFLRILTKKSMTLLLQQGKLHENILF